MNPIPHLPVVLAAVTLMISPCLGQPDKNAVPPTAPIPMPSDRAAESYRIYSMLMPGSKFESPQWPRGKWLIADTTKAVVRPGKPCKGSTDDLQNPHFAVSPPPDRTNEFQEVLEDFDRRCHERIRLTPEGFRLSVPFSLLTESEQAQFVTSALNLNAAVDNAANLKFSGAPGINKFSQVYFNQKHSLAMVYTEQWCGGLCGSFHWVVLELKNEQWTVLPWVQVFGFS
jgi:hypothetical protein